MLYDPKWERTTDLYALASFISWLETMPPGKEYDYYDCAGGCLLDQYLGKRSTWQEYREFPVDWRADVAAPHPRTFGGALGRARDLATC